MITINLKPRKGHPISEETKRKISDAQKGKFRTKATKRKISSAQRKLTDKEINAFALDYIYFDDTANELAGYYGINISSLTRPIRQAILMGFIDKGEFFSAKKRRKKQSHSSEEVRMKLSEYHLSSNGGRIPPREELERLYVTERKSAPDIARICNISSTSIYKLLDKYGLAVRSNSEAHIGLRYSQPKGENSPNFGSHLSIKTKQKISEIKKGKGFSDNFKLKLRDVAIKDRRGIRLTELRQARYTDGAHNYSSKDEYAVAQMLQRYVSGFKIEDGKTFQAVGGNETSGHCIFDFVLPNAIVEWHPIVLKHDSYEDHKAYEQLKKEVKTKEERTALKEVVDKLKDDLAVNYWLNRQEYADNSQVYNGMEVILARTPEELYDSVISRHSAGNAPSKYDFVREFRSVRKQAQPISKKQKSLEEKVESKAVPA